MVGTLEEVVGVPITATQAGAYMRPQWYAVNFQGGDFTQALLNTQTKAQYDDALKVVFHEQELAGLDVFTDGCLRYDDWIGGFGWASHLAGRLGGVKWVNDFGPAPQSASFFDLPTQPEFLKEAMWQFTKRVEVVDRLNEGNLQFAEFYRYARRFTDMPLRYTTPEACITSFFLANSHGVYKDDGEVLFDLANVINGQLRKLVDAGCEMVQLDYPFFPPFYMGNQAGADFWGMVVDAFNTEVRGVNAQIWIHLDWGRPMGQLAMGSLGSLEEFFRRTSEAKYDVVGMEAASTQGEMLDKELAVWKEHSPDKDICIGGVNHRTALVESPEQVAQVIHKALNYVPPEKLAVYNDCGLSHLPRPIAYGKIKAIAAGCRLVRKELGLKK